VKRLLYLIVLMVVAAGVAYLLMRTVARTEVTDVFSVPAPITEVSVATGSGSIAVDAGPDDALTARITKGFAFFAPEVTTAGSVIIVVPRGPYRVDASAGAGSVTLEGLTDTPSADRVIIASASAGDVTVRAR
jgi:hypothetical protein